jgi:hypothetical protein
MATWIWIMILLIFGFVAFAQPDQVARAPVARVTGEEWEPVTVGQVVGVIVAPNDAPLFVDSLGLDLDDDAYWQPTFADVEAAEVAVADEAGELEHKRQYAGYIENGERKVFINGFCDRIGIDWRERPVLVQDGGDCFFMAVCNVHSGELERFQFNGEA